MQKLDPRAVWLFFFGFLLRTLVIFVILAIWLDTALNGCQGLLSCFWWIAIIFVIFLVICWIWARLSYHFWRYQLTENAFKKEQGIIWKRYVSIPYDRIQNVDINRGLLARILGLSNLYIQTAGYSSVYYGRGRARGIGAEGYLPGLERGIAENLQAELINRSQRNQQGL